MLLLSKNRSCEKHLFCHCLSLDHVGDDCQFSTGLVQKFFMSRTRFFLLLHIFNPDSTFLDTNFEPRFPTECFFLTIHCQHIALLPAFQRHMRRMQMLQDLERLIAQTEQSEDHWRNHPVLAPRNRASLRQWKTALRVRQLCGKRRFLILIQICFSEN